MTITKLEEKFNYGSATNKIFSLQSDLESAGFSVEYSHDCGIPDFSALCDYDSKTIHVNSIKAAPAAMLMSAMHSRGLNSDVIGKYLYTVTEGERSTKGGCYFQVTVSEFSNQH